MVTISNTVPRSSQISLRALAVQRWAHVTGWSTPQRSLLERAQTPTTAATDADRVGRVGLTDVSPAHSAQLPSQVWECNALQGRERV